MPYYYYGSVFVAQPGTAAKTELQWRARGNIGFEKQQDRLMELTYYQVDRINSMPDKFYLIVPEPECTNVCFWYIPKR